MRDTYFISYPRCGRRWQETRMTALLEVCWDDIKEQFPNEVKNATSWSRKYERAVRNTHLGFEPMGSVDGVIRSPKLSSKSDIFVLVREARFCTNSHFYYIENNIRNRILNFPAPRTRRAFILSDWSAPRFCRFLNHMHDIRDCARNFKFLFYEDLKGKEAIHSLPEILGIDYKLNPDEVRRIHQLSNSPVNTWGTKHKMPDDLVEHINNYMHRHCRLPEYRRRYLGD